MHAAGKPAEYHVDRSAEPRRYGGEVLASLLNNPPDASTAVVDDGVDDAAANRLHDTGVQRAVVRENKLKESCYLRPIAFYGSEKMGVSPVGAKVHVAIAAWPWGAYLGPDALAKGIRVKTSSYARHHINVTMARAKMSGTYPNSVLATLEATQHGYDEGLLLDVDGFVAEGAGENIFMIKDGKIYEPELTSALTGITRGSVIELAEELGYEVISKRLTRDDIYIADECFFTGTAAEVTPIRELDGRVIGAGKAGPITKRIQDAFFAVVTGKDKKRRSWLTPVK